MKVIDQTLLEKVIIERCRHSHKGDYGRLLLLGGNLSLWGSYHHVSHCSCQKRGRVGDCWHG